MRPCLTWRRRSSLFHLGCVSSSPTLFTFSTSSLSSPTSLSALPFVSKSSYPISPTTLSFARCFILFFYLSISFLSDVNADGFLFVRCTGDSINSRVLLFRTYQGPFSCFSSPIPSFRGNDPITRLEVESSCLRVFVGYVMLWVDDLIWF